MAGSRTEWHASCWPLIAISQHGIMGHCECRDNIIEGLELESTSYTVYMFTMQFMFVVLNASSSNAPCVVSNY